MQRINSDEKYVLDLVAEILMQNYEWQKRFESLLGDEGCTGKQARLPVDAYFDRYKLIVEYREKQHIQSVPLMDNKMTISGVSRKEQRRIYNQRKEKWARENGYNLLIIYFNDLRVRSNGKLVRDSNVDKSSIRRLIALQINDIEVSRLI